MDQAYHIRKRQRDRKNESAFRSVIKTPASIAGGFVMPANGHVSFSYNHALTAGQMTCTVGSHAIKFLAISANATQKIGYFEKGMKLVFSGLTGFVLNIYLVKNNGVKVKVATGVL
jgi:hypothetical protein